MAQVILGGVGGLIGGGAGRALGGALGGVVDRGLIGALSPARQRGPRLETLRIQSTAEGAPMACVFGRARVTGQMIWAARFLERRNESGGGKGGPRTVDYAYSLSFAVAISEGPIDGIGRIWADGKILDQAGVALRVYRGSQDQMPDPLIEAVEAAPGTGSAGRIGGAPAYRGTAYVVFEDLPLGSFGDRVPQLSFEVFRRPGGETLEEKLEGVCLIPGAGEFVLATGPVMRRDGLTRTVPENVHLGDGRPDLTASLDQLQAQCPNLKRVSLVVGWFGDDLRASHCRVKPGVERRDKLTEPQEWSVAGLGRENAHLISEVDGSPAYGGTPSDDSVRQAVAALKARGWAVTLYPFVFMDLAADNALPDPYGGVRQPAYPWRGRIVGRDGSEATADVAAIFGGDWGLRRLALHYAGLAAETGCDGLLIGSEMRGLTWTRDATGGYPAVAHYRSLAADCRAVAGPEMALSYAADWSEYSGHRPDDGSGDVIFHLDPLWADDAISYVGIDWYPPLGDWRDGDGGIDAGMFGGPDDPDYLARQVAGGERFDWYYAGDPDRAAQTRTPIRDTSHGEDWVFRAKDLVGWWSNPHHDRPAGVRRATPTAWVPGMKPIRLTEFGCAAVDRGGNAPNLFQDPKSSESFLPPFSTGARDDRLQRRALEAVLTHFESPTHNPMSATYGGPMLEAADAWCWDARPYPAFPARADVWADVGAWSAGHWLNGRMTGESGTLLAAILRRGGVDDFEIGPASGAVSGYVIDRPMRTRDALEPLLQAFDMAAAERGGRVSLIGVESAGARLKPENLALTEESAGPVRTRSLEALPGTARVRFIDEGADYQTGATVVRGDGDGGGVDEALPAVCDPGLARALARRLLRGEGEDRLTLAVGPLEALRLEAGDTVAVEGEPGAWRVERMTLDEIPKAVLARRDGAVVGTEPVGWRPGSGTDVAGAPFVRVLDLPPLPGAEAEDRPIAIVACEPWRPMTVHAGQDAETLTMRGTVAAPATVGRLTQALVPGVLHRWDETNTLVVRLEGAPPASLSEGAVLAGKNLAVVETASGWEILQYRHASLSADGVWRLSGLLRGQQGTEGEMSSVATEGSLVVLLDPRAGRIETATGERGLARIVRAGPAGDAPGGPRFAETTFMMRGLHARPWSPVLTIVQEAGGRMLRWTPRVRIGDVWDLEPVEVDPRRFRVRVLDGALERRVIEADATSVFYGDDDLAADFPDGVGPDALIAVSQYGLGFGWGVEAQVPLIA
ncbi:glycoside hydrolase/phage tail family protein [Brevundimonas sp.]|uniref:baseplate multidomain protein megatron n=1 Tax=Brevundimonas sp. TaxID=1871086 RepID=UPI00260A3E38|nr:glycoside hydrolase/phage tail family protein [Brevundimonas sp.]